MIDAINVISTGQNDPLSREFEGTLAQTKESAEKHQCLFFVARMVCVDGSEGFCGIPAENWDMTLTKMTENSMIKEFIPIMKVIPRSFN